MKVEDDNIRAELDSFSESIENWGLTFNARKNFKKYIEELSAPRIITARFLI